MFAKCEQGCADLGTAIASKAKQSRDRANYGIAWSFRFSPMTDKALKLRLVARLDFGLRLRLAQFGLVMDHLADARQHRALDFRIG